MTMPLLHGVLFVVVIGALVLALAIDVMFFADVAATEVAAMTDVPENGVPGFVGFDDDGNFVHYCHCGKWGAFGVASARMVSYFVSSFWVSFVAYRLMTADAAHDFNDSPNVR